VVNCGWVLAANIDSGRPLARSSKLTAARWITEDVLIDGLPARGPAPRRLLPRITAGTAVLG
jgi:hypothetical protein